MTRPTGGSWLRRNTFGEDTKLKKIVIPREVTQIDESAISGSNNLCIYGYANSEAQVYAEENNIPFIDLEAPEPTPSPIPTATPTITPSPSPTPTATPINGSHVKVDKLKYRYYNSREKCRNALEKGVKQSLIWLFFVAIVNLSKDLLHSTI